MAFLTLTNLIPRPFANSRYDVPCAKEARISRSLMVSPPVAVIVTDRAGPATGVHRLLFSSVYPDNPTSTATVDVGGSVVGRIDSNGDRDWFAVQLDSAGTCQIDLRGTYSRQRRWRRSQQ